MYKLYDLWIGGLLAEKDLPTGLSLFTEVGQNFLAHLATLPITF